MSKNFQKTNGPIVITFGFVIYLLGAVAHEAYFSNIDPFIIAENERIFEWVLRLVRDLGLTIGFGGMIVFGIRILRRQKFSIKNFIMPATGLAFFVLISFYCFYFSREMESVLNLPAINTERLSARINDPNISMTERVKLSELYSVIEYEENGRITEFFNINGEIVTYKPSDEQVKNREEMLFNKFKINWAKDSFYKSGFLWVSIAVSSVVLGFFPNRKMKETDLVSDHARRLN